MEENTNITEQAENVVLPDFTEEKKGFFTKNRRLLTIIGIVAVVIAVALFAYSKLNGAKYHTETMSQTISEVKKISEFCTANYIGEVMIQDEEKKFLNHKKIILIVKGKIRAGFDLTKMETEVVDDTTINLLLPPAQILDIITNPSDIRTFSEKGTWTHERTTITKNSARKKLIDLVLEDNLLSTAEENGIKQLTTIFSAFGFKQVNISFTKSSNEDNFNEVVGDSVSESVMVLT